MSNLPLGVCVLNEYRCRGLGTYLLHDSLRRLHERGLEEARLVTRKGLPADRYLYPKFGGVRARCSSAHPPDSMAARLRIRCGVIGGGSAGYAAARTAAASARAWR